MKVFCIAALTADGFIGRSSDHLADWTSKEDKAFFSERTKEAGVIVFGYNTYTTIGRPLPGRLNIVYAPEGTEIEGARVTRQEPKELIAALEAEGYEEVAIGGGAQIYTMFVKAGVVDELYLTVEPVLFGSGVRLFTEELEAQLQLTEERRLNGDTVLLHYKLTN